MINHPLTQQTVYIETSVVSYLTARLSHDLIMAAHQKITFDWWENRRSHFDLYTSELVIQEAGRGDPQAAKKRLNILPNLPLLDINEDVQKLVEIFLTRQVIPTKVREDAIHISIAIVYGIDYLLTWNCKHIANVEIQKVITKISNEAGYEIPIFCTPEVLMGE